MAELLHISDNKPQWNVIFIIVAHDWKIGMISSFFVCTLSLREETELMTSTGSY